MRTRSSLYVGSLLYSLDLVKVMVHDDCLLARPLPLKRDCLVIASKQPRDGLVRTR